MVSDDVKQHVKENVINGMRDAASYYGIELTEDGVDIRGPYIKDGDAYYIASSFTNDRVRLNGSLWINLAHAVDPGLRSSIKDLIIHQNSEDERLRREEERAYNQFLELKNRFANGRKFPSSTT
jgi:hypothetical protein